MAAKKRISEKQRRRRSLRQAALACLEMELPEEDELRQELLRRGLEPSGGQAVMFRQWTRAVAGDHSAAKFLRDAAEGEEPPEEPPSRIPAAMDLSALTDAELRALAAGEET